MNIAQHRLTDYISERRKELQSYADRDNAKNAYINHQNQNLKELTEIADLIEDYSEMAMYDYIEKVRIKTEKEYPELGGITIIIRTKPEGLTYYLPINLYE